MQTNGPNSYIVKVADFGLSNTNEGDVLLDTACGSPCYAAPEMIAGKKYDGRKSDMWSLGVVLFTLVCGYLPFEDDDTPTLYRKILAADYSCPSYISYEVRDLLGRILDTDPATRLGIAAVRNHPWFQRHALRLNSQNQSHSSTIEVDQPSGQSAGPDQRVLDQLEELGFPSDTVKDDLRSGRHNPATASYFLLHERLRRSHVDGLGRRVPVPPAAGPSTVEEPGHDEGHEERETEVEEASATTDEPEPEPTKDQAQIVAARAAPPSRASGAVHVPPKQLELLDSSGHASSKPPCFLQARPKTTVAANQAVAGATAAQNALQSTRISQRPAAKLRVAARQPERPSAAPRQPARPAKASLGFRIKPSSMVRGRTTRLAPLKAIFPSASGKSGA